MAPIGPALAVSVLVSEIIVSCFTALVVVPHLVGGLTDPSQDRVRGSALISWGAPRRRGERVQHIHPSPQGRVSRAFKRREDNPKLVTGTLSNMALGDGTNNDRLTIRDGAWVAALVGETEDPVGAAFLRDLRRRCYRVCQGTLYVGSWANGSNHLLLGFLVACEVICTARYRGTVASDLRRSVVASPSSRYPLPGSRSLPLSARLMDLWVVLKRSIFDTISTGPDYRGAIEIHKDKHPNDAIPILFHDPNLSSWFGTATGASNHVQIDRDAFSYEDGPKVDLRATLDIGFLGEQDVRWET